ncbi:M16 family metallopeptidase [Reichenbachiella versicolor]|uniref:M16 family metallopeptidase n=1 Tax=Reichenbachiella versicolor TaxID=1821036 RepID=UPI000D6E0BB6|nr:pitrilysin family protein [Reichenbachiella versicolor]
MTLDRTVAPPSGELFYSPFAEAQKVEGSRIPTYYINAGEQSIVKLQLKLKSGIWYESFLAESWFVAKMLMEGTKSKTAHELSEAFQALGAFIEIDPGFDDVSFNIYSLTRNYSQVLDLFNEILTEPTFPEKELETLKQIRLNEHRVNNSKTSMVASKKIRESLYGLDHPYGKAIQEENIQSIQRNQLTTYFNEKFFNCPELFLSGKIDDELLKLTQDKLTFPFLLNEEKANPAISGMEKQIEINRPDNLQSSIKLAWHIPSKLDQGYFDLAISNTLLGGYFGSRLMKNIREEKGYTYGIHSYPVHLNHASFLLISTDVKGEYAEDTINETFKEIEKIINQPTTEEEIEMVVNYLSGTFYSSVTTPFKLMGKFMQIHNIGAGYEHYERYFESLKSFDVDKLQSSIKQYLNVDQVRRVVVGPMS